MLNEGKRQIEISSAAMILDDHGQHHNRVVKLCDFERRSLQKPSAIHTDEPHVNVTIGITSNYVITETISEATKTCEQLGLDTKYYYFYLGFTKTRLDIMGTKRCHLKCA